MGKSQRTKGAVGEREVADVFKRHGYTAARNRIGTEGDDVHVEELPHLSIEVKRAERLMMDAWLGQAELQAGDRIPMLAFRKNGQPWRAVVPLDWLVGLIREAGNSNDGA